MTSGCLAGVVFLVVAATVLADGSKAGKLIEDVVQRRRLTATAATRPIPLGFNLFR